jgi:hypothetical protein
VLDDSDVRTTDGLSRVFSSIHDSAQNLDPLHTDADLAMSLRRACDGLECALL